MDIIKSRSNQFVKYARKVSTGSIGDEFFVEGKRLAGELLKAEIDIESVFATPEFVENDPELFQGLASPNVQSYILSASIFSYLSQTKTPQGIAAVCKKPSNGSRRIESNLKEAKDGLVVLLHGINNPGNLGAIIRTAEAFGAAGVITTKDSADPFSGAAVRGSMGSVFRLPVWRGCGFPEVIEWAGIQAVRTICAERRAANPLSEMKWYGRSMLVLGSEAHGLSTAERELINEEFSISMSGQVESLNLAVAAGIAIYAAANPNRRT